MAVGCSQSAPSPLSPQEFRQRSLDWEKQRLLYQQQVASLEAQRKALAEQSELVQVQLMCAGSLCFVRGSGAEAEESSGDCHSNASSCPAVIRVTCGSAVWGGDLESVKRA